MSETIEKTFPVSGPARLNLSNICGSVEIRPGEENAIQVTAVKQTGSGDAGRTLVEMTQQVDGTVSVVTRYPDGAWNWLFGAHPCLVDYVVTVPRRSSVKVSGVSSELDVQGLEGEFNFRSVSGEISLRDLTGPVSLRTVSGKVQGERLSGAFELDTVSGDVTLRGSDLPQVKAATISGDLELQTGLGAGPYAFKSVSGDVCLRVPADARCTAELHTISGIISTALPPSAISYTQGVHTAQVQGGGVKVYLHSVSGDLCLECDEQVSSGSEKKTPSVDERRSVLESLARGEMSVDEAVSHLKG